MTGRQRGGKAMEQPRQTAFTADEFIAWAQEQPSGRFELENGRVVAMAPERAVHALVKGNAYVALRAAVLKAGLGCRVFPDGMAVRIDGGTVYEPDTLVRCGPDLPGDAVEVGDPVVVVEVISPSSRGVDRGAKLAGYFGLPSVRHYLIIDTGRRVVIHHARDGEGRIAASIASDGEIALDPPGVVVAVREMFEGV